MVESVVENVLVIESYVVCVFVLYLQVALVDVVSPISTSLGAGDKVGGEFGLAGWLLAAGALLVGAATRKQLCRSQFH